MTTPSFRIDQAMLKNFSPEAINNKTDLLGFYKSDDHTYVITTRDNTTDPHFISQSSQIAALFADAQFSIDESLTDARDSIKFLQYLDCVYRVIDRHNSNVAHSKEHGIVQFLLQIPLISSVVEWVFDQLLFSPPESACGILENKQREIVKNYFDSADNLETLTQYRQNLLDDLTNAETHPLRGKGLQEELWMRERRMIQQEFETQIFERSDALQLAQKIVDEVELALDFDLEIDHFDEPNRYTARLQSLTLSPELIELASDAQKLLIKTAHDKTMEAFGKWHLQHIQKICEKATEEGREALLTDLLVSNNPEEFTKKFFSLVSRLSSLQADKEIVILNTSFSAYRKGLIEKRLCKPDNLQMLQMCKEELLKELEITKTQPNPQHAKDYQTEFWKNEQLTIQIVFEDELTKRSPILQKAQGIMDASDFKSILGYGLDVDPFMAAPLCNEQRNSLVLPKELIPLVSVRLQDIVKNARLKINTTYGNWHSQRINIICENATKNGTEPQLEDLLVVKNSSECIGKYKSLINLLTGVSQPVAIEHLHKHYENQLAKLFYTLRESLEFIKTVFLGISDVEVLTTKYKEKNELLDEWYSFKKSTHSDINEGDLEDLKRQLKEAYEFNLVEKIPCFGTILDILGERKSTTLLLTQGSISPALNQSEKWYRHHLDVIRLELSQPYTEHLSSHVIEKMREGEKCLLIELSKLKDKQVQELLVTKEKSKSIFDMASSLLPSFLTNIWVDNSEQPLQSYREMLLKVLDIEEDSQIEKTYASNIKELSELPNTNDAKNKIINLYESYQRALKIQPLIRIVSSGIVFSGDISLLELTNKNGLSILSDIENFVNELTNLVDLEIQFQNLNKTNSLVQTLETVKSQLEEQFESMIITSHPVYEKMKEICEKYEKPCLGMHDYIFKIPFQDKFGNCNYKEAVKKYAEMLKKFEVPENANQPMKLSEASIKTKAIIVFAYKEWEAEHILYAYKRSLPVLGLPHNSSRTERIRRYRYLQLFLHPDKNKNYEVPQELADKFDEATRHLGNPP